MFCSNCGEKLPKNSKYCIICGANVQLEKLAHLSLNGLSKYLIKRKQKMVIRAILAIGIIVGVAFGGAHMMNADKNSENKYIYFSNNEYQLIQKIKSQTKDIGFASNKTEIVDDHMLTFSPGGKYVYYYTDNEDRSSRGTLCRTEFSLISNNSENKDQYVEAIASNVERFDFLDDESVAYMNKDGDLFYYNGTESFMIDNDVEEYYLSEIQILYKKKIESEKNILCGVDCSNLDNKIEFDRSNIYLEILDCSDFEHIIYYKEEKDESKSLYLTGFNSSVQELGKNVQIFDEVNNDGKLAFTAINGESLNLYDYVKDSFANEDAKEKKPHKKDFVYSGYDYSMIDSDDLNESHYSDVYTSCIHPLCWYGGEGGPYCMDEALYMEWENSEGKDTTKPTIQKTQKFINKFSDSANDEGYIPVTDDVKNALKDIDRIVGNDGSGWLWFCYTRKPFKDRLDSYAYHEALDRWHEVEKRNKLRKSLKSQKNAFPVSTLYSYDHGKIITLRDDILDTIQMDCGYMTWTKEQVTETLNFSGLSEAEDVYSLFYADKYSDEIDINLPDGSICHMSASAKSFFRRFSKYNDVRAYFTNKEMVLWVKKSDQKYGTISIANIRDGVVEAFSLLDDNTYMIEFDADNNTFYYQSNIVQIRNEDNYKGDLCIFQDGKKHVLVNNVCFDRFTHFEDGMLITYSNFNSYDDNEWIVLDQNGNKINTANNVFKYIRVEDSLIFYISNGELYSYDGKKNVLLRKDVSWLWSKDASAVVYSDDNHEEF